MKHRFQYLAPPNQIFRPIGIIAVLIGLPQTLPSSEGLIGE